ncbi:MAG: glutaminase A [Bacteroidaceae bacterium]|nr:glutaminase A [Bacteroidaceae bacterium]
MEKRISKKILSEILNDAYEHCKKIKEGNNANYIPYLAKENSDLFAISLCFVDGDIINIGDYDYTFGIESISKVATALLVLKEYGCETIQKMIGADATGLPFNSILAILLENDHPSTPLVNAGAIAAVSLVRPVGNKGQKWKSICDNINALCGSRTEFIEELYHSESLSNFKNRSIAWLLKSYNRIYDDPELSLDLYTKQCSLGVTTEQLSIFAATIANGGINPKNGTRIFESHLTPKITSMIASVGFYEHSGDWLFSSGLPAKTGVSGGVMGLLPGLFGISAFAPPIDNAGNSVRAQAAIKYIMEKSGFNIFDCSSVRIDE